uniref:CSN8/PSMD8/EIF3K domain-containing protein n=1 Tax=Leptocylindrus danicus TaxID=163516 RepID=A0A7S2LFF6_9STRA|mmetsp:Transcript_4971/g.7279  ORF Transcript_4971/g.7279 Transcript_4971/m.7279 type:complete len:212 (+) Transcript_4971:66-701(+)
MEMTRTLPSLQDTLLDNELTELRGSTNRNINFSFTHAVIQLSALLSLGEYEHARHLCRRKSRDVSSSNDYAHKALEMLWEVTKFLVNDNVVAAFGMLRKMASDFSAHDEILCAIAGIKNAIFAKRAAFLARSFSKVEVGFAAKELGFENSVEELVVILTKDGWSIHESNFERRFLVPPKVGFVGKASIQGNDALDRMLEVVTFMECKRLNE